MKHWLMVAFIVIFSVTTISGHAEDRIELDKEAIIGNKEAPKAIYIVPWRSLIPNGVRSLEISALLDEELEMIDPEVFKRQIELYELVYKEK